MVEIQKLEIVKTEKAIKSIQIGKLNIPESKVREYGIPSEETDFTHSKYAQKNNGNPVLMGEKKFSPSRANQVHGYTVVTLEDGTTWKIGLSKTGLDSLNANNM